MWPRVSWRVLSGSKRALADVAGRLRCPGPTLLGWLLCAEALDHEISIREDNAELELASQGTDVLLQRAQQKIRLLLNSGKGGIRKRSKR